MDGLYTICRADSSYLRHDFAIHMDLPTYQCRTLFSAMRIPQKGRLWITTECGRLQVCPGEIVILAQRYQFAVDLPDRPSRGYFAETFGTHLKHPDLRPILNMYLGANGVRLLQGILVNSSLRSTTSLLLMWSLGITIMSLIR